MAITAKELIDLQLATQPYLIGRGILPVKGKCIIGGAPKANKSYIALNMALALAQGKPIFGAVTKSGAELMPVARPCRVLYIDQEMGEEGLQARLKGEGDRLGLLTGVDVSALPLWFKSRDTAMRVDTSDGLAFVMNEVKSVRPDVVFLDPMAKFHLGDENSAQDMGAVLRATDHIIEDFCASVVWTHHSGKEPSSQFENPRRGGDRLRGSSAIFADCDSLILVDRKSDEHVKEPIVQLSFELRRGEPVDQMFIKRHRDGHIDWLGEGFVWGKGKSFQDSL